jgi:hypothetical protein
MAFDLKKLAAGSVSWGDFELPYLGQHFSTDPTTWMVIPLLKQALEEEGPPVLTTGGSGNLVCTLPQLLDAMQSIAGVRILRVDRHGSKNQTVLLGSGDTMLQVYTSERGKAATASIVTNNQEIFKKISALFSRVIVPEDVKKGLVFTLATSMQGYTITSLGAAGSPIERGNYTKEVLEGYDHLVADLNTDKPCGRLVILSGPPGTGKTFLVRSILSNAPKAAFILVPPNLVKDLNGPDILPALVSAKRETNGPIVLVIEDADQCLVKREDGDMATVSTLLNLGDGILGSVLDVRILATTNATKLEIDPATQRPGRLCRHVLVEDLDAETASKVLQRLTKKPLKFKSPKSLAQVYVEARKHGWAPEEIVPDHHAEERPEILG